MKPDDVPSKRNKRTNNQNTIKVPSTVFSFYKNLYISRKSSTSNKKHRSVAEAKNSWLSLSESEKQQVNIKFMECKEKYKLQILNQLKNAEPFMKIKHSSEKLQSFVTNSQPKTCEIAIDSAAEITQEKIEPIESLEELKCANESPMHNETPISNENDLVENEIELSDTGHISPPALRLEPIPPAVKSAHELFCMLASIDEERNNATWTSLSRVDKSQYSRAVSIMKKDYLHKYREYVESLTSKQLFEHYHKTISN